LKSEIQARMSDYAGIICRGPEVSDALTKATALRKKVETEGLRAGSPSMVGQAFRWKHMAYVSEAVLTALDHYIQNGGGSRGARTICSEDGQRCPEAHVEDLSRFRFVEEQPKDKEEKLVVSFKDGSFEVNSLAIDSTPEIEREFFEKGWGPYLIKEG
jgi:succinate dehydrogenase / fumarate reductase flavoprotein subunit